MIPIGDDQVKGGYKPIFTWMFLIINVLVFLYQLSLGDAGLEGFINQFALIPANIIQGQDLHTIFTSMFMHGGWMHLIGNMIFLKIFGDNIEARIGNIKFLIFYLVAGVGADFLQILVSPHATIPNLGASGAISGVLGAYLLMFPQAHVKMLHPGSGQVYLVSAKQFLIYWIVIQLFSGFGSLATSTGNEGGVAYFAHIGGFIVGLVGGGIMKKFATAGSLEDMSLNNNSLDSLYGQKNIDGQNSDYYRQDRQSHSSDPLQALKDFLQQQDNQKRG